MNQKKSTKILLIFIIILIILILLAAGVFTYFATDLFKSDKELFFKYITQIGDEKKGFFDKNLSQYIEKRENVPFNNQGSLSLDISGNDKDDFKALKDFNISFSGQVDTSNKNITQNINLNYSSDVKFPVNYKQKENNIGIQLPLVTNKYIAVDLSKNELKDEYFSEIQESDLTGYKISLKNDDINNIIVKLLETLKEDQETLNKINEYLNTQNGSSKITVNDINSQIKNIQNSSNIDEDETLEVIVYKNKNAVSKIELRLDSTTISLEKNNYEYMLTCNYEGKKAIQFLMSFDGLQSLQNIKEKFELKQFLDEDNEFTYKLDNEINFTDKFNLDDFDNENSWMLTNYDNNSVQNFLKQVGERVEIINKEQMAKLGLKEDENPLIYMNPFALTFSINMKSAMEKSQESMERDRAQMEEQEELLRFYEKQVLNSSSNESNAENIEKFNNKFEVYKGTNLSAQTVKGLLTTISLSNENSESYKIKEINFEGQEYEASEQNITFVKSDVDMSKNYRVEFEKDQDTGIIYRVIINAR